MCRSMYVASEKDFQCRASIIGELASCFLSFSRAFSDSFSHCNMPAAFGVNCLNCAEVAAKLKINLLKSYGRPRKLHRSWILFRFGQVLIIFLLSSPILMTLRPTINPTSSIFSFINSNFFEQTYNLFLSFEIPIWRCLRWSPGVALKLRKLLI